MVVERIVETEAWGNDLGELLAGHDVPWVGVHGTQAFQRCWVTITTAPAREMAPPRSFLNVFMMFFLIRFEQASMVPRLPSLVVWQTSCAG
jgi:hypothetical protein